jgi:limonene-1,2-epoxide hydrolase
MMSAEQVVTTFYKAFQKKDFITMQQCYADGATFNDEVFKNLDTFHVRAMWEMLIKSGKDLRLEFNNVKAKGNYVSAEWVATYTFSKTQRKVINRIKAAFIVENGKIIQHTDHFNFYKWSQQALGFSGYLLGWTGYLRKKVQATALKNLTDFIKRAPAN